MPGTRKEPDIAEAKSSDRMYTNVTRSITIGRHELTPYRDVPIVDADDLERTDDDQRIHRYGQKGVPLLRADWEGLREEATPIDQLWNKKCELIQTHAEKAAELFQSQNLFSTIWNWGLNANIHPWIHISHAVVLLRLFILFVF
ncbi:hypothetical protein scyTo_0003362 [Scyliorhinus torazame]|uniref:Uncharacterized protein n=1 Tax=Scyliorhinus torazame TaxID=75743 RepID=A0A401PMD9_SCYTO|nr:hypothetical protein [Scyliorhinus torazame]